MKKFLAMRTVSGAGADESSDETERAAVARAGPAV